jgi:hypothetical protein
VIDGAVRGPTLALAASVVAWWAGCASPPSAPHVGSDLRDVPPVVSASASTPEPAIPAPSASASAAPPPRATAARASPFPPAPIAPPVPKNAKPGDGVWSTLAVTGMTRSPLATTVIHPHKVKPFVVVAFVAIDLSRLSLGLVAGTEEPKSDDVPASKRTGLIPEADVARLVVAMNGGFKRRHGEHGMKIGPDTFVPPKDDSCTLARTTGGAIRIGTWTSLAGAAGDYDYFRQGPPCLVEAGAKNPDTADGWKVKKFGASETGDREIRRSAFALSKDGETLYFAIGDWIHPEVLADALVAAGVDAASQFDINYSFTRFVLYDRGPSGEPVASSPLLEKLKFSTTEYWKSPSARDFFYLTRR